MKTTSGLAMAVLLAFYGTTVRASTFTTNNPSGIAPISFSIDFVTVGDAGNTGTNGWNYTSETHGGVNYNYRIGKTEISVGQYNALTYAVSGSTTGLGSAMAAGGVSTMKALMYANWLNAGCLSGGPVESQINGGVYNFTSWATIAPWAEADQWDNGDGTKNIWRNKNAKYFLPGEDELVKAAFYKGGSTTAGYWRYPTSSNTAPTAEGASTGTNSANYDNVIGAALPVGSHPNTVSPYGALDMAGNLFEMAELRYSTGENKYTPVWMGNYVYGAGFLYGTTGYGVGTDATPADVGFRIATVIPEPTTLSLLGLVASLALIRRKKYCKS